MRLPAGRARVEEFMGGRAGEAQPSSGCRLRASLQRHTLAAASLDCRSFSNASSRRSILWVVSLTES